MVRVDRARLLVGARKRVVDALGVGGIDAGVLLGVDDQCGTGDACKVRLGARLRVPEGYRTEAIRLELMRLTEQDASVEKAVEDYCWGV